MAQSTSGLPSQGGIQSTATGVEVMDLTADSQLERQKHEALLVELEAKKRAFSVDVPTLPHDVRVALRQMGHPVRLFGENPADVRDRLRMELARRQVLEEGGISAATRAQADEEAARAKEDEDEVTKYTRASSELVAARNKMAEFSLQRAQQRLALERKRRAGMKRKQAQLLQTSASPAAVVPADRSAEMDDECMVEVSRLDDHCAKLYKSVRSFALEGSQYGDTRALSAICTSRSLVGGIPIVATGSWSGGVKLWDGSSPQLEPVAEKAMAHEDRIMGMALQTHGEGVPNVERTLAATTSIDLSAKLWRIEVDSDDMSGENDRHELTIVESAHLKGHAARLCRVAFHPMGTYVATTSFDHTWRLWDLATGGKEILLQDGHSKQTYGVGFHPDGSLCATTDFGGVVQVWDLRTGKSISHFLGHAKRVLCSEFSPNGFQLATAGDDGTVKVWDLRRRKQAASIPAHSNLITQLRFASSDNNGEYLASSSFDGTAKLWSTRDWKLLSTLRGHEGKVMGIDVLRDSVVTSGYDKTLKLWR